MHTWRRRAEQTTSLAGHLLCSVTTAVWLGLQKGPDKGILILRLLSEETQNTAMQSEGMLRGAYWHCVTMHTTAGLDFSNPCFLLLSAMCIVKKALLGCFY